MKSELAYERYAHGEPPVSPAGEDILRMEELRREDAAFLELHPPASFFRDVERKRRRRTRSRWIAAGSALAASIVLAVVGLTIFSSEDGTRMKGSDLNMFVYHKTDGGTEILERETTLAAGDEIQIAYYARGRAFAAILSVDGRGTVTRHMPLHGSEALEIDTKDFSLLPYSYRLDDAPSFEDLYLIVSPRTFKVDELKPFLAAGFDNGTTKVLLPAPFRYATVRVKKTEAEK